MSDNEELLPCQCFPSSPSVHPPDNKICVVGVVGDNGGGGGVMMAVLEVMIYPNPLDNKIYVAGVVGGSVSSSGGGGGGGVVVDVRVLVWW